MTEQPQIRSVPWRVRWRPRREVAARMYRLFAHAHRGIARRRAQLQAIRGLAGAQVRISPRPFQRQEVLHEEPHAADEVRVPARASEQDTDVQKVGTRGIRRAVPTRPHATSHVEPNSPAQCSRRKRNCASLNKSSGRLSARDLFHFPDGHITRSRQL